MKKIWIYKFSFAMWISSGKMW